MSVHFTKIGWQPDARLTNKAYTSIIMNLLD